MTDPTVRSKPSEIVGGIYLHVFTDGSGGFFSLKDGQSEPLNYLIQEAELQIRIQEEFNVFKRLITGV